MRLYTKGISYLYNITRRHLGQALMKSIYAQDIERYVLLSRLPIYNDCIHIIECLFMRIIRELCYCTRTEETIRCRDQYIRKRIIMAAKHNKTLTPSMLQSIILNSEMSMICAAHQIPRIILVGNVLRQYDFDGKSWHEVTGCCCGFDAKVQAKSQTSPQTYISMISRCYDNKTLCGSCADIDFVSIGGASEYAIISAEHGKWRIIFN